MMIITVYPVPGRLVLRPDHGFSPVPPEGHAVSRYDQFYQKALMSGDLTETPPVAVNEPASKAPAAFDEEVEPVDFFAETSSSDAASDDKL